MIPDIGIFLTHGMLFILAFLYSRDDGVSAISDNFTFNSVLIPFNSTLIPFNSTLFGDPGPSVGSKSLRHRQSL